MSARDWRAELLAEQFAAAPRRLDPPLPQRQADVDDEVAAYRRRRELVEALDEVAARRERRAAR